MKQLYKTGAIIPFLFFFFLLGVFSDLVAQPSFQLYTMQELVPQSIFQNPAFKPVQSRPLGVPALSLFSVSGGNNGGSFSQFLRSTQDSLLLSPLAAVSLGNRNRLEYSLEHNLFYLGVTNSYGDYLSFSFSGKAYAAGGYSKDLGVLLLDGNTLLESTEVDVVAGTKAYAYYEFAVGYNLQFRPTWRIGARFKALKGITSFYVPEPDISATSAIGELSFNVNNKSSLHTSGFDLNGNSSGTGSLLFNGGNWGAGLDIGFVFHKDRSRFKFSASALDLGLIYWTHDTYSYPLEGHGYTYRGVPRDSKDYEEAIQVVLDDLDSIYTDIKNIKKQNDPFITFLTPRVYLSSEYLLRGGQKLGVLLYGSFYQNRITPSLNLSYRKDFRNGLSFALNGGIINREVNLGGGASYNFGAWNVFLATDNLPSLFIPTDVNTYDLRLGASIDLDAFGSGLPPRHIQRWNSSPHKQDKIMYRTPPPPHRRKPLKHVDQKKNWDVSREPKKGTKGDAEKLEEPTAPAERAAPPTPSRERPVPGGEQTPAPAGPGEGTVVPKTEELQATPQSENSLEMESGYYVAVESFPNLQEARNARKGLKNAGLNAEIGYSSASSLYYVYKSRFKDLDSATEENDILHEDAQYQDSWVLIIK